MPPVPVKTVTLQTLAEGFSLMGTPVFAVDVKGDLSGIAAAGSPHPKIEERLANIPLPAYRQQPCPTLFWDMDGKSGHPVRTTISEMGPLLLANLLELNDTQTGVLYAGFDLADDQGLLLLDLKDLRALLAWMGENARSLRSEYGQYQRRQSWRHPAAPAGAGRAGGPSAFSANRPCNWPI